MNTPKTRVAIVGCGIAGLTVAHELSRTDRFDITVYEQKPNFGGKARSLRLDDGNVGEHALRVFLASYSTLYTVMQEIPFGNGTTYDNLVYGEFNFKSNRETLTLETKHESLYKTILQDIAILRFLYRNGVGILELCLFTYKIARFLWLTPSQVDNQLANISFEDYMGGSSRSKAFQDIVLRVSEMLVAAKRSASAAVVGRIFIEWYVGPFLKSRFGRLGFASLNGPTSERFIDPWVEYLSRKGVKFVPNTRICAVEESGRLITGMTTNKSERISADVYVIAVQHNILDALLSPQLKNRIPGLHNIRSLQEEWSNGLQYFLKRIPSKWTSLSGQITVAVDTEWSIVYRITTRDKLWLNVPLPDGIVGVLSLVVSNAHNNGRYHRKPYIRCTEEEILDEALVQIGWEDREAIARGYIGTDLKYIPLDEFVGRENEFAGYAAAAIPGQNQVLVNDGQLYIRNPGNLANEPSNETEIYNLFLAGEFTRTKYAIPTMEKSCESGMRCAQSICHTHNVLYDDYRLVGAELPLTFLRTLKLRMVMWLSMLAIVLFFTRHSFGLMRRTGKDPN